MRGCVSKGTGRLCGRSPEQASWGQSWRLGRGPETGQSVADPPHLGCPGTALAVERLGLSWARACGEACHPLLTMPAVDESDCIVGPVCWGR